MAVFRGSRAHEWTLLAISLLVALVLAEAVCRFVLPRPGFFPRHGSWLPGAVQPHPRRLYSLTPGFSAQVTAEETFGTMHIDINADGLRERPLPTLRDADLRVLALGDSYTFGYGLEASEAWPARLEAELRSRLPGRSVAVVNAGIPGFNLAQMEDMAGEMTAKTAPQLIVAAVYAGGFVRMLNPMTNLDDMVIRTSELRVVRLVDGGVVRSDMHRQQLVDIDLWLKAHWYFGARVFEGAFRMFDAAREWLEPPQPPATPAPADPLRGVPEGLAALERMRVRAEEGGVALVVMAVASFGPDGRVNPGEAAVNRALERFCASARIPFFDPSRALQESHAGLRVRPGDYHWSAAADALAARELAGFLLAQPAVQP